jgi:hypothetical protein
MSKKDPKLPGRLLQRMTQWFNDLRRMLVAAGRACKALTSSIDQMILLCLAITNVLHDNETSAELLRKVVELLAGA